MIRAVFAAFLLALSPSALAAAGEGKLVSVIRFSDHASGSVDSWMRGKGFVFEQDARNRAQVDLRAAPNGLLVNAKRPSFGFMPNESVNLSDFSFVEIDWGVTRFPAGASYEQGIRNEALMVIVFLGDERQSSGSMFIPDSPYFIGLFICHGDDRVNHPYVGSYFKKSGRYVCVDRPKPGELVTTRFNLFEAFHAYFDKDRKEDPGISGIALALDTKKAGDGGVAEAFIREIRFYE
jgi:hypothetical protein